MIAAYAFVLNFSTLTIVYITQWALTGSEPLQITRQEKSAPFRKLTGKVNLIDLAGSGAHTYIVSRRRVANNYDAQRFGYLSC